MRVLNPRWTWGELDLTDTPFLFGFDSDLGSPDTPTEAVAMLLQDGEVEVSPRASNRTLSFKVYVEGPDLRSLSEAEHLLSLEADKTENTFTFDPGDGFSPISVFDTYRAQLRFIRDDEAEAQGLRAYSVTMRAQPYVRTVDQIVVPALPIESGVTPTTETLDPANSMTNWSARIGTLSDQGSFLRVSGSRSPRAVWTPPAPVSLVDRQYVSIDYDYDYEATRQVPYLLTNYGYATLVSVGVGTVRASRATWHIDGTSLTDAELGINLPTGRRFDVALVTASNVPPHAGSTKQTSRTIEVQGSVRTQGEFMVSAEYGGLGTGLGTVLIHTSASPGAGAVPSLREHRVSGSAPIIGSDSISGHREDFSVPVVCEVPASRFEAGSHQMIASLYTGTAATYSITVVAQAVTPGGVLIGPAETTTQTVTFTVVGYQRFALANISLPTVDLPPGSTALIRFTLSSPSSALQFDDAWPFNLDTGSLTWVEAGLSQRIWIENATARRPRPAIYVGDAADKSDAYHPSSRVMAWEQHEFKGATAVYVIASGTDAAAATFSYYPKSNTHTLGQR